MAAIGKLIPLCPTKNDKTDSLKKMKERQKPIEATHIETSVHA